MNRKSALLLPSALVISAMLAACSTGKGYPSLALRDFERPAGTGVPTPSESESPMAAPPEPVSADLSSRLAGLVSAARKSHDAFTGRQGATERSVAAAGGVASDSWITAHVALAQLQSARSGAMTALAELDSLYVDARAANPDEVSPSAAAIGGARDTVSALVAQEDAVLTRLGERLRG